MEILIIITVANLLLTSCFVKAKHSKRRMFFKKSGAALTSSSIVLMVVGSRKAQNSCLTKISDSLGRQAGISHTSLHRDLTDLRAEISDTLTKRIAIRQMNVRNRIQESKEFTFRAKEADSRRKLEKTLQTRLSDSF